jgi:hypothetical protein
MTRVEVSAEDLARMCRRSRCANQPVGADTRIQVRDENCGDLVTFIESVICDTRPSLVYDTRGSLMHDTRRSLGMLDHVIAAATRSLELR